ncbi:MAG: FeoB-associated Cys-rich membrane protein [Leptotrichia hofstadii]
MVKTVIVAAIAAVIVLTVFRKIYKDYKKNKNFCGTDCCSCSGASSCNSHREAEDYNK